MEITKSTSNNIVTLSIQGRIDTSTAEEFEKAVSSECIDGIQLILDFSNVEYISSAGLRVILLTHKKLVSIKGKLIIKNVNEIVLEVFDMTGFSSILNIEA